MGRRRQEAMRNAFRPLILQAFEGQDMGIDELALLGLPFVVLGLEVVNVKQAIDRFRPHDQTT